jgi:membrane protein DedA with SNARE-associated domain
MLGFDQLSESVIAFARDHAAWIAPITFLITFAESLAIVSLFVPSTVMLLGIGALVAAGAIGFWEVFAAAVPGAILGNWLSYWVGKRFKHSITESWLFRKRADLMKRGHDFFERHGGKSVFVGRFFGPTRAIVPLIAGMTEMPRQRFLLANASSAVVWVVLSIAPALWGGTLMPNFGGKPAEAHPVTASPDSPAVPIR